MAVATWYGQAAVSLLKGETIYLTHDIKVLLATAAYVPDVDNHDYKNDITGEVAAGGGYSTGGVALTGKSFSYNATTNTLSLVANTVSWPASTITARYAIIYNNTPATDATRPLLGYVDFQANEVSVGNTFSVPWDSTLGMLYTRLI